MPHKGASAQVGLKLIFLFWKSSFIHNLKLAIDSSPVSEWHGPFLGCIDGATAYKYYNEMMWPERFAKRNICEANVKEAKCGGENVLSKYNKLFNNY